MRRVRVREHNARVKYALGKIRGETTICNGFGLAIRKSRV